MFLLGINKLRSSAFKCLGLLSHVLFSLSHLRVRVQLYPGQMVTVQGAWPSLTSLAAAAEGSACISPCTPGSRYLLLPLHQACDISALLLWLKLEHSPISIRVLPSFSSHAFCGRSKNGDIYHDLGVQRKELCRYGVPLLPGLVLLLTSLYSLFSRLSVRLRSTGDQDAGKSPYSAPSPAYYKRSRAIVHAHGLRPDG